LVYDTYLNKKTPVFFLKKGLPDSKNAHFYSKTRTIFETLWGHFSLKTLNQIVCMKSIENLFNAVLNAVGALANNDSIFKKRKKAGPFNPKLTLGFNFIQGR
jgi:hypothetical protein